MTEITLQQIGAVLLAASVVGLIVRSCSKTKENRPVEFFSGPVPSYESDPVDLELLRRQQKQLADEDVIAALWPNGMVADQRRAERAALIRSLLIALNDQHPETQSGREALDHERQQLIKKLADLQDGGDGLL